MRRLRQLVLALICSTCAASYSAGASEFDVTAYQQFLEQHADMTTSQLLEMYPAGDFDERADISWESVLHHDLIEATCKLTEYERSLLRRNGFVVTERLRQESVVDQLLYVWREDLPLFISTDAILHAFHYYYDTLLIQIESGILIDRLTTLLAQMHAEVPHLVAKYSKDVEMQQMLRDVDVYLTVARRLLGQNVSPHYASNAEVNEILDLIDQETLVAYPLFSESCKEVDFSQFKPRGHYTQQDDLKKYFRAMMWLGRIELYLLPPKVAPWPCPRQTDADIQRQTIDAVLLLELMDAAGADAICDEIEQILCFLVGEQDNVSPPDLTSVVDAIELEDASQLLDPSRLQEFQDTLKTKAFAFQRILSQVLRHDPYDPDGIEPASSFMLFGQRFVIDSYVTGNVVFDQVKHNGQYICRLLPSTLDILFALGNDAATHAVIPELNRYHYSSNLAGLRYLIDSYDPGFWNSSIYNMWLNSIRTLNLPVDRGDLPSFMQTAAWWQQKMNTQLASWTELRHDNLLYAKQSYTGGLVCSYPCAYVEPFPELYRGLSDLAQTAHDTFAGFSFADDRLRTEILDYYDMLGDITDTLGTIAEKELNGTPIDEDEMSFMRQMLFRGEYNVLDGWYPRLLYGPSYHPSWLTGPFADYLVADYHTTPTDCAGAVAGWVLHAGTGPVDLAIVTAALPGTETAAFVGPVMSYYEYKTTNFLRLTDEQWADAYLSRATRPDWVNSYLADRSGQPRLRKAGPDPLGDLDFDRDVDLGDFAVFAGTWLTGYGDTQWNPTCDISVPADNSVDTLDLSTFATHWLTPAE